MAETSNSQSVHELLDRIETEALDGDIVKALLLCQKLGGYAGSDILISWAKKELTGWPAGEDLPDYRLLKGAMVGHGFVPYQGDVTMPIPTDGLPKELVDGAALMIAVRPSISEVQEQASRDTITVMPRHSGLLARLVTERNAGSVVFNQIHLTCPGSAYGGIVTTVRTRLITLVSELGRTLPAEATLDDKTTTKAVSRAVSNTIVLSGDHNTIAIGEGNKTIGDNRHWLTGRRLLGTIAGSMVVVFGALLEVLRREAIWPF